ncbi:MAG TPA: PEP-CTERM sorting domain-containing protein [Candidatus Eisenbacteria bacterium]|nr:PEP-CTERM sorting domain-containing protein [Candidatus Eisenbacteria bacterium]
MNQAARFVVTSFVLAAASLPAVGDANAVPSLPQTRVPTTYREAPTVAALHVLPAGYLGERNAFQSRDEFGLGYFAPSVRELHEVWAQNKEHKSKDGKTKKAKRNRPALPPNPGLGEHPKKGFGDPPVSNDPVDHEYVNKGKSEYDLPRETVEVPEPPSSALLLIGMVGLLLASRRKKGE